MCRLGHNTALTYAVAFTQDYKKAGNGNKLFLL